MQPRQKLHFAEAKLNPALGRFGDWLTDAPKFQGIYAALSAWAAALSFGCK